MVVVHATTQHLLTACINCYLHSLADPAMLCSGASLSVINLQPLAVTMPCTCTIFHLCNDLVTIFIRWRIILRRLCIGGGVCGMCAPAAAACLAPFGPWRYGSTPHTGRRPTCASTLVTMRQIRRCCHCRANRDTQHGDGDGSTARQQQWTPSGSSTLLSLAFLGDAIWTVRCEIVH